VTARGPKLTDANLVLFVRWLQHDWEASRHSCSKGGESLSDSDQCGACHDGPRIRHISDAELVAAAEEYLDSLRVTRTPPLSRRAPNDLQVDLGSGQVCSRCRGDHETWTCSDES
jgi:hypothetical protein